jgi:hypothetical protein
MKFIFSTSINNLPSDSFVMFVAKKLTNPFVVIYNSCLNNNIIAEDFLTKFGYIISSDLEAKNSAIFYAERYGGGGIGNNGGGVRCGLVDGYQIKGIGKAPVVGKNSDCCYGQGGMSLEDAIREYIWGEVLHEALPYGACRAYGVIETNTNCWVQGNDGQRKESPAALIVRQAAVRPAHFERAPFFQPTDSFLASHPSDTERTKASINVLQLFFSEIGYTPSSPSVTDGHCSVADSLKLGLNEVSSRFARQFAAAKAKRLMHGCISSSNICLDGRWIDFGTVSSVTGYGNVIIEPHQPAFWDEHKTVLNTLKDLCFYLEKYHNDYSKDSFPTGSDITQHYINAYSRELRFQFLLLTGCSSVILQFIEHEKSAIEFAHALLILARTNRQKPFVGGVDGICDDQHNLGKILIALITNDIYMLDLVIKDSMLSTFLVELYVNFFSALLLSVKALGVKKRSLNIFMAIGAYRQNKDIPMLYRDNLLPEISKFVGINCAIERKNNLDLFISDLRKKSRLKWSDCTPYFCLIYTEGDVNVYFDLFAETVIVNDAVSNSKIEVPICEWVGSDDDLVFYSKSLMYWGDDFGEMLIRLLNS